MHSVFQDHPRKQVVRSKYDTPLLSTISEQLGALYLYLGLPGPDIYDIRQWKGLIRRIIAFERRGQPPKERDHFIILQENLIKSGIPFSNYYGDIETVVILGRDLENREFVQDEMITLYNLDFCDHISSKIALPVAEDHGGELRWQCMRFEAIRRLLQYQAQQYARGAADPRFIVLLTAREAIHCTAVGEWQKREHPPATQQWLDEAIPFPIGGGGILTSPPVVKAFVFSCFRAYCVGAHIQSHFLPIVRYQGVSGHVAMAHFAILCRISEPQGALPPESQSAQDFLRMPSMRASEGGIDTEALHLETGEAISLNDAVNAAQSFFS